MARQALYRFCALTLLDPRTGGDEQLADLRRRGLIDAAAELVRREPGAKAESLALGEHRLSNLRPALVRVHLPRSRSAFNELYERTFGLLSSCACPPCEAEYIFGKHDFQRSQTMADVSGFYRAFGLQPSRRHPERHDHIVLELEFMAFLLGMERRALQSQEPDAHEKAELCRAAQQRFMREHLAWWAPALGHILSREDAHGFYSAAGVFLSALIAAERALLNVPPPTSRAAPSAIERPEECEGCQIGS
jgi:TorA maturation chaperone TorD